MIEFTDEQRDALRTAMEDRREEMGQLSEKMRDARTGLQKEILAEKQNPDRIKSFAKEVAELQAELTVIQAKAFAQARPKFTADQLEKLKNSPMGIEMLMRGGMQGRGGPGGPGFGAPGEGRRPGGDAPGARPEGKDSDSPRPGRPRPDAEPK